MLHRRRCCSDLFCPCWFCASTLTRTNSLGMKQCRVSDFATTWSSNVGFGTMRHSCKKMTPLPLSRACAKAARRLGEALQRCRGSEQDDHGAIAQWQEWLSMYLGETHETFIDVDGIAAELSTSPTHSDREPTMSILTHVGRNCACRL